VKREEESKLEHKIDQPCLVYGSTLPTALCKPGPPVASAHTPAYRRPQAGPPGLTPAVRPLQQALTMAPQPGAGLEDLLQKLDIRDGAGADGDGEESAISGALECGRGPVFGNGGYWRRLRKDGQAV
jgi:hypothetical protein